MYVLYIISLDAMLIYEVNLLINSNVFDAYMVWLPKHVDEVLAFDGFQLARYFEEPSDAREQQKKITVQYEVDTVEHLNDYLDNHSHYLRDKAIQRFQDNFSATRRILHLLEKIETT